MRSNAQLGAAICLLLALCACGVDSTVPAILQGRGGLSRLPGRRIPTDEQARVMRGRLPAAGALTGPGSVSLRGRMTPVKDQAAHHTCAIFSLVALLESAGSGPLSEQCISYLNPGGDAGFVWENLKRVEARGFLVEESSCPYDGADRHRVPAAIMDGWEPVPLPGTAVARAHPSADGRDPIGFLREQLAQGAPVALSVYMFGDFWVDPGATLAPVPPQEEIAALGEADGMPYHPTHSMVAVGYSDALGAIEIRNSWGKSGRTLATPT